MNNEWENVYFLSHVNIKNIIGKELINNDNVAVMELVKNSYDAGAKEVTVEFKNLKSKDRKNHEIIIADDGIGMSKEDILHKWLNLAYSIKRVQNAQNNRLQAGNKGIGRFSCDRLGKKLDIYTKKDDKAYHLRIDWEDFENIQDYNVQINQIPMKLKEVSDNEIYQDTAYNIGKNGTIIKISYLRTRWIKFNEDSLFNEVLNYQKFVSLKSALEKLINKSQVESDNFKILLKVDDIDDGTEESYNKKINGEIENKFFEKLDFDTTYIHSAISDDGQYIITKLKDRDKVIFKTIEKNIEFPDLKGVKIILMHLNPYGKAYFRKQMGVRSVDFGSVYLFINGFRIPPYGEIDNDSFGLEMRKGQGQRRYLGGREIIGRIEIEDRSEQYQVISSREGIVQNEAFRQLIHKSTKSTKSQTKNNGFFYKTLKRLEKYVVEGLKWDSVPRSMTEATIKEMVEEKDWKESKEIYLINRDEKLKNISKNIFKIMSVDFVDIMDLNINDEVLSHLIEKDTLKTQKNITQFLKDFSKIPNYAVNEKTKQFVKKIVKNIGDKTLLKKVDFILDNKVNKIDNLLDKEETYNQFDKKIKILENEQESLKKELKTVKTQKEQKDKQILFLQSIQTLDQDQLLNLQHHIGLYSHDIEGALISFKREYSKNKNITEKQIVDFIDRLTLANKKVLTINKLATKSNFLTDSEIINEDIVSFINEYINTIYLVEDNKKIAINVNTNGNVFKTNFSPFELTIVLDNLLSNAKKVNKPQKVIVDINIIKNGNDLVIEFSNTGKGLDSIIDDSSQIFEQGFTTTTNGSGLGLYHVKQILEKFGFKIKVNDEYKNGFQLIIYTKDKDKNET